MRFVWTIVGGLIGTIPGIALIPSLEFIGLAVAVLGFITGAMIGAAPPSRRRLTAKWGLIGLLAGAVLFLVPGFGLPLGLAAVIYGGWYGMKGAPSDLPSDTTVGP